MEINKETSFHWRLFYVFLPLFPFLLGGLLKFLFTVFANMCNEETPTDYLSLFLSNWDSLKLAFSTSLMAFLVKKDLMETKILLSNDDKIAEVKKTSTVLFIYGTCGFVLFGVLFALKTLQQDCCMSILYKASTPINVASFVLGFLTIKYVLNAQKSYKLESKSFI
jgi:predicted membrane protein